MRYKELSICGNQNCRGSFAKMRSNQIYCSRICSSEVQNKKAKAIRDLINRENQILKLNLLILMSFETQGTVTNRELLRKGYHSNYVTHLEKDGAGNQICWVYCYGLQETLKDTYKILTR